MFSIYIMINICFYFPPLFGKEGNGSKIINFLNILKVKFSNIFILEKINFNLKRHQLKRYIILNYHPLKYHSGSMKRIFNDPDIEQQWYFLRQISKETLTHDLESVWEKQITGKDIIVGMIGAGLEVNHKDLRHNYKSKLSYNFVRNSHYIHPLDGYFITSMSGLIAATSNNDQCGVGAAPSSWIVSLQIFDEGRLGLNDIFFSKALIHKNNNIPIYVIYFNLLACIRLNIFNHPLSMKALEKGIKYGRSNLGSIFLMASGTSKEKGSNCAFRGFVQMAEIFIISSILNNGKDTKFSETCTAILAAAINTQTNETYDLLYTTNDGNKCGKSVGGKSAISLSIAAGIISLLLSDNPNLTNRQVMISIILSSTQNDHSAIKNAAGFRYSYHFGFGLINASELIRISREIVIQNLPIQHICSEFMIISTGLIEKDSHSRFYLFSDGCFKTNKHVTRIEQLFFTFSLETYSRKSVTITMTSAKRTTLKILEPRFYDNSTKGFNNWRLKILGFFGENPFGDWMIDIYSKNFDSTLKLIKIEFYGISNVDESDLKITKTNDNYFFEKYKKHFYKKFK